MILITGATGYIGKDLIKQIEDKDNIRILTRQNLFNTPFEVVKGSVTDIKAVKKAMKDVDYVFHLAVSSNHFAKYSELFKINVKGTENVMKIASKNNVKKVVHMSSMAAAMPIKTAYGETKKLAEEVVKRYWDVIEAPILRAPLVYDFERLMKFRKIFLLPMTSKNFKIHILYKNSLISAIKNAMKLGRSRIYNIADKKSIKFHSFHKAVLNTRLKPIYVPHIFASVAIALSYPIKHSFNLLGLNPPITPEFIRHIFQDREFDIKDSIKNLKYKPVDTLKTIKFLYRLNGL